MFATRSISVASRPTPIICIRSGSYMTRPEAPASFYWTHETWGAALRCRPLEPIAQHLFTTRQLQLPSAEGWQSLADALGVAVGRVVWLNQVHGREVVTIRKNAGADALAA